MSKAKRKPGPVKARKRGKALLLAVGNPQIAKADGREGQGCFLSFHGAPKSKEARRIDIHEGEPDVAWMAGWVKQAAALPGRVT